MARLRHVWLKRPLMPTELPGLVLDWRRDPDGWHALVVSVDERGRVVIEWATADSVRPVAARPSNGSAYG